MQADPEKSLEYFASAAKQGAGAGLRCRSGQPACGLHPRPSRVLGRACAAAVVRLYRKCSSWQQLLTSAAPRPAGAEEEFGSQLHPIRSRRDYEQLVSSGKTVVVDFMAPWCGKVRACGVQWAQQQSVGGMAPWCGKVHLAAAGTRPCPCIWVPNGRRPGPHICLG